MQSVSREILILIWFENFDFQNLFKIRNGKILDRWTSESIF